MIPDDIVLGVIRFGLALVFLVAGVAKLRDPAGARQTVGGVGVPTALRPAAAFLLSVVELGTAALLVLPGLVLVGGSFAFALLSVFLFALTVQHVRGVDVPCACFGELAVTPAGKPMLIRNAVLLVGTIALLLAHL